MKSIEEVNRELPRITKKDPSKQLPWIKQMIKDSEMRKRDAEKKREINKSRKSFVMNGLAK